VEIYQFIIPFVIAADCIFRERLQKTGHLNRKSYHFGQKRISWLLLSKLRYNENKTKASA